MESEARRKKENKTRTHHSWPIRTEPMYDIFVIFNMKEGHQRVNYVDDDDWDEYHLDDDDHHEEHHEGEDEDDHHDRRRARRLQVRNSPIFRKNVLLDIEKVHREIEQDELWK